MITGVERDGKCFVTRRVAVTYRLPLPVSVNNLYRNAFAPTPKGTPRNIPGRLKTKAHKRWWKEAAQMLAIQRLENRNPNIPAGYRLTMVFQRCKRDLGNLEKCCSDLLVDMGVVQDDSLCQEIVLRWGEVSGVEVTIEAV